MDYLLLAKILLKWSVENKEYTLTYFLYTNIHIGIPTKFLYLLPIKNIYSSLGDFLTNNNVIYTDDYYLRKLLDKFKLSKYTRLNNWNNEYGYII